MEIRGAVVIITGASEGLGAATARLCASRGAQVALAARSVDTLDRLSAELSGAVAIPTDIRDPADIRRMVAVVQRRYGRIDLLINNAGQGMVGPLEHTAVEQYRSLMDLNLYGPLLAMQAVIPIMRAQGGGMILNVSSPLARLPVYLPGPGAYGSTKAALSYIMLTARAELAADNIRVGVIYPGVMATDFGAHLLAAAGAPSASAPETAALAGPALAAPPPMPAEQVAAAILDAVQREVAEQYADPAMEGK
jgi:NADP-dependent 3-hydroxy acid dehydrogenase YdfG